MCKTNAGRFGSTKGFKVCSIITPAMLESIALNSKSAALKKGAMATMSLTGQLLGKRSSAAMRMPMTAAQPKTRSVYDARHGTRIPGTRIRSEGSADVGVKNVDAAYKGAGDTYDMYLKFFGRNSLDGSGMEIISSVNYGKNFLNGFFDGTGIRYGNGDGELFNDFTSCIDVISHELTHGVSAATSQLQYQGQSGALNESMSDCFGSMTKQIILDQAADEADWLIGAGLITDKVQGRGIRDMMNPGTAYDDRVLGKDPQPATMDDYLAGDEDSGQVHGNSGIANRAFAVACTQAGGKSWGGVGLVWYDLQTKYLAYDSDFADAARGSLMLAKSRFGDNSAVQHAIQNGWEAAKIKPKA